MLRLALPLTIALSLPFAVMACGSDTSSTTCGAGTHLENGTCVADNTGDTSTGQDTFQQADSTNATDTTTNPTDTGAGTDGVETDTAINTECTPDEASSKGLGVPCSKECECDQALGLECYSGAFLEGFSFCTRHTQGPLDLNTVASILLVPGCFADDIGAEGNKRVYTPQCTSTQWCKENLGQQYTDCGTGTASADGSPFPYTGEIRGIICVQQEGGSTSTMSSANGCIIRSAPPFAEALD